MPTDELFPEIPRQLSRIQEVMWGRYPMLQPLGLEINKFGSQGKYIRVEFREGAKYYEVGNQIITQWTDQYQEAFDNEIKWSEVEPRGNTGEGFAICAVTPTNAGIFPEPLLHVMRNITDVENSFALRLDDITRLWVYPENASEVKAMQQNAWEDGGTYHHNQMRGYGVLFSSQEVDAFAEMYWPEPELVFQKQ